MSRKIIVAIVVVAISTGCSSQEDQGQESQTSESVEPEVSADLEPFLTSYFATWSAGDMDGYKNHFHPRAMIYLIKSGDVLSAMPRDPFVDGQESVRAGSKNPGVEKMTAFEAQEDRVAAVVTADWELIQGNERTVGVDRFTLMRDEQWRWKIISLLFYTTGRGEASVKRH